MMCLIVMGCGPRRPVPTEPPQPASSQSQADPETLWAVAQDVLRAHGFLLERVDARGGRIATRPELTPHFFEFWRRDVVVGADAWESTLSPIRRRVEVTIDQADDGGVPPVDRDVLRVQVIVKKERFSSPDRQFNSSAAAYHFFSDTLPAVRTGGRIRPEDSTWVPMGRDPAMEQRILDALLAEATQRCEAVE